MTIIRHIILLLFLLALTGIAAQFIVNPQRAKERAIRKAQDEVLIPGLISAIQARRAQLESY